MLKLVQWIKLFLTVHCFTASSIVIFPVKFVTTATSVLLSILISVFRRFNNQQQVQTVNSDGILSYYLWFWYITRVKSWARSHEAFVFLVLRGSPGSPIQLSVNFGVAISPRHECTSTFTDITPSYLVFLKYVILIHKSFQTFKSRIHQTKLQAK